jgi:predicted nucleic acid-binding protein
VNWLLDTNTIIYAQYVGGPVRERLDDASKRGRVVTSVLVIAELFYGAAKSSRPQANRRKVAKPTSICTSRPLRSKRAPCLSRMTAHSWPAISKGSSPKNWI